MENPKLEILRNSISYLEGSVRSRDLDKKSKRCNLEMSHSLLIACKCSQCLSNSRGHILNGRKNNCVIFNVIDLRRILYLFHAYANIDLIRVIMGLTGGVEDFTNQECEIFLVSGFGVMCILFQKSIPNGCYHALTYYGVWQFLLLCTFCFGQDNAAKSNS